MSVTVTLDMGMPVLRPDKLGIAVSGDTYIARETEVLSQRGEVTCLGFEKTYCVLQVADAGSYDIQRVGDAFADLDIFPRDIVCCFSQIGKDGIVLAVWEKGRERLCSIEAAAAAAAAAFLEGKLSGEISVTMPCGKVTAEFQEKTGRVKITGPAETVYAL